MLMDPRYETHVWIPLVTHDPDEAPFQLPGSAAPNIFRYNAGILAPASEGLAFAFNTTSDDARTTLSDLFVYKDCLTDQNKLSEKGVIWT